MPHSRIPAAVLGAVEVKPCEKLAQRYLISQGYANVIYHPDGPNVPPDFLCDGRIAVEVRRLNQNYASASGYEGLETAAKNLESAVSDVLQSFGPPINGESWFVSYRFSRPLPTLKKLKKRLENVLSDFKARPDRAPFEASLMGGFTLKVFRASGPGRAFFMLGLVSDEQSGGFTVQELEDNLQICIAEKNAKIAAVRQRYPEWWLVLPDHIGYFLGQSERNLFRKEVSLIQHHFKKIILLNPRDPSQAFEI